MIDIDESGNISRNDFIKRNSAIYEGIKGVASSVGVIPGEMDNKNETIKKMARLLNIKQKDINKKLSAKWVKDDYFVPIKTIKKHSGEGYTSSSTEWKRYSPYDRCYNPTMIGDFKLHIRKRIIK